MNESKTIKFLRVSYWAGTIFDALLLTPSLKNLEKRKRYFIEVASIFVI